MTFWSKGKIAQGWTKRKVNCTEHRDLHGKLGNGEDL